MTVRLREAAPDADVRAYRDRIDRILANYDRLEAALVRQALDLLADARRHLIDELTRIGPSDDSFLAGQLRAMREAIDWEAAAFARRYSDHLDAATRQAWQAGADAVPDLLDAAGIRLTLRPTVSRAQLEVISQFRADLVQGVTADVRDQVTREIARSVLGGRSLAQALQGIQRELATQPDRATGRLGSLASQAERIVRTEMGTAFSLANHLRQEEVAAELPAIRKYWLTAADGRVRLDHALAGQRYRPGGQPGPIRVSESFTVGGERARFPHDPALTAANRINCRCVAVLWHPEWPA